MNVFKILNFSKVVNFFKKHMGSIFKPVESLFQNNSTLFFSFFFYPKNSQ